MREWLLFSANTDRELVPAEVTDLFLFYFKEYKLDRECADKSQQPFVRYNCIRLNFNCIFFTFINSRNVPIIGSSTYLPLHTILCIFLMRTHKVLSKSVTHTPLSRASPFLAQDCAKRSVSLSLNGNVAFFQKREIF